MINFSLQPPDTHHLSAAIGWLELGNPVEAGQELAKISAGSIEHPDVLEVRWAVCAAGKSWEAALGAAELLWAKSPERVTGWIHRAYALRRVRQGGLQKAWDALRPAFEKFPQESIIPYNLACYASQMGRLDDAWDWLLKAIAAAGGVATIKQMALADADLQPLWARINEL
jgi:tetratricopeptide (TPR) repeat protein